MDKKTITRNFSRYALLYDKYADIQKKAAAELLRKTRKDECESILELGCGTGNYTLLLRERFKKARIKAVDICEKMISVAQDKLKEKGVEFMVADAEDLNLSQEFDLITSNACFQWFEYLEKALLRYKALLSEKGAISFSIFGPQTFFELNSSIKAVLGNTAIAVDGFMAKEKVKKLLLKNFRQAGIREVLYRNDFASLKDLLDKIKYTGTGGGGLKNKIYFSRRLLGEIEKAYLERFEKVSATYQVFFCEGKS